MSKPKEIELTQEELREIFDYNPETGVTLWVKPTGRRMKVGDIAGSISKTSGYLIIGYNKRNYRAHRLAWIYMNGSIPDDTLVDHKDLDKTNNKIDNLRLCSKSENLRNVNLRESNKSGCKGVYWYESRQKWAVKVGLKGVTHFLGYFNEKAAAISAHRDFCKLHDGEFYRDTTKCNIPQ